MDSEFEEDQNRQLEKRAQQSMSPSPTTDPTPTTGEHYARPTILPETPFPRGLILRAGITLEVTLLVVSLLWIWLRGFSIPWSMTTASIVTSVVMVLFLCVFNFLLLLKTINRPLPLAGSETSPFGRFFDELARFRSHVIFPIVCNLNFSSALLLALLSGLAEELFFRGALWSELMHWGGPYCALVGTSILFALAHFGSNVRLYPRISLLYLFFGFALGLLFLKTQSMPLLIASHAAYNLLAFALLTRGFRSHALSQRPR